MFPVELPKFIFIHRITTVLPQDLLFCLPVNPWQTFNIVQFSEPIVNHRIWIVSVDPGPDYQRSKNGGGGPYGRNSGPYLSSMTMILRYRSLGALCDL
jgi:hypothetical protein